MFQIPSWKGANERVSDTCDELSKAIDHLLLAEPSKTLVVEPEVQDLLRVAHLRRDVGRALAAIAASHQEDTWRHLRTTLETR